MLQINCAGARIRCRIGESKAFMFSKRQIQAAITLISICRSQFYDSISKSEVETELTSHIEGSLATEMCLVVLDTLEMIVQVASTSEIHHSLLGVVLKVLLHALARNQSTLALQNLFATQRSLIFKYHNLLFDEESDSCADLCLLLLKHCGSQLPSIRSQAAASLYLLMRQNFEIGNVIQLALSPSVFFVCSTLHSFLFCRISPA